MSQMAARNALQSLSQTLAANNANTTATRTQTASDFTATLQQQVHSAESAPPSKPAAAPGASADKAAPPQSSPRDDEVTKTDAETEGTPTRSGERGMCPKSRAQQDEAKNTNSQTQDELAEAQEGSATRAASVTVHANGARGLMPVAAAGTGISTSTASTDDSKETSGKETDNLAGLPAGLAALLAGLHHGSAAKAERPAAADTSGSRGPEVTDRAGLGIAATDKDQTRLAIGTADDKGAALARHLEAVQDKTQAAFATGLARAQGEQAGQSAAGPAPDAGGAGLALLAAHTRDASPSLGLATPRAVVTTPVGQNGWAEDVGNKVSLMLGRKESQADLVLTPSHLGKLEISLKVDGDQATASFIASTQAARDALDQALPRLREVLQQAGINLSQSDVNTSNPQSSGRGREDQGAQRGYAGRGIEGIAEVAPAAGLARYTQIGLVDTFA